MTPVTDQQSAPVEDTAGRPALDISAHPDGIAAPPHWEADVVAADGGTVHLRPITPADSEGIVGLMERSSDQTRYYRFFGPMRRLSDKDLYRFTHVDHDNRVAFVVLLGDELIGVGRYDRYPGTDDAEVAFLIEDAHQRRGLGSVLLEHLAAAARERGITRFVAEVLSQNGQMVRVFLDAGYSAERSYADGVVHLTFPIAPTEQSLAVT
ncbi:MAG: Acetate--CoA ligase forming, partial [Modestobacter sp.]|nr:Acetate--CoA ligase forming [Modestobacter sp.]